MDKRCPNCGGYFMEKVIIIPADEVKDDTLAKGFMSNPDYVFYRCNDSTCGIYCTESELENRL